MFPAELIRSAKQTLEIFSINRKMIVTAESCTGGLISVVLTEIPGSSSVVDRGFVTYSNAAKVACLNVPSDLIAAYGAVSRHVAIAMAQGALTNSCADVALAVTGIAGPGGGTAGKPVGLVHIAAANRDGEVLHRDCLFGDLGRTQVRLDSAVVALELAAKMVNR